MSALWRDDARDPLRQDAPGTELALVPMSVAQLDAVLEIEQTAYAFPWSRGNFVDSLAAGYLARVLRGTDGAVLGYFLAMAGVDEMHLLNLTVAPAWQRRGLSLVMLDALEAECRRAGLIKLWLEVRLSNQRARAIYERYGFLQVGLRKGYYPAAQGSREDAAVMVLERLPGAAA